MPKRTDTSATVIASRTVAGLGGGLLLTNAMAGGLSMLPISATDAYYWTAAFAVACWTAAFMWAFSARSTVTVWAGVLGASVLAALPMLLAQAA